MDRRTFLKLVAASGTVLAIDPAQAFALQRNSFGEGIPLSYEDDSVRIWYFNGDGVIIPNRRLRIDEAMSQGPMRVSRGDQLVLAIPSDPRLSFRWIAVPGKEFYALPWQSVRFQGTGYLAGTLLG